MIAPEYTADLSLLLKLLGDSHTNDRTAAIICVSYAEKYLGELVQELLPGMNSKLRGKLFDPGGTFSEFSIKIDLAKALGSIDTVAYSNLKCMASIRNKFAHNLAVDTFSHPEITSRLDNLGLPQIIWDHMIPETAKTQFRERFATAKGRSRFEMIGIQTCISLHNMLLNAKTSRQSHGDKG